MSKQRDKIRMDEAEIVHFLDECRSLNVATLDKGGSPHMTTVWFAMKDGCFLFETYGSSQKVVNLRRYPRIAVLCEQGTTYDQLRGVSVQGKAEIVDSNPRLEELMQFIVKRNNPDFPPEELAKHTAAMIRKRVVVVVHPEKTMSWDHRKLGAH
ncbi:MAG: pyridoxamine 5'-phosphate oxidase family protein [Rhizomicrobium sp.]